MLGPIARRPVPPAEVAVATAAVLAQEEDAAADSITAGAPVVRTTSTADAAPACEEDEEGEHKGGVVPWAQEERLEGGEGRGGDMVVGDVKDDDTEEVVMDMGEEGEGGEGGEEVEEEEEGEEGLHDAYGYDVYNPDAGEFVDEKVAEAMKLADLDPAGAGVNENAAGADAAGEAYLHQMVERTCPWIFTSKDIYIYI